MNNSSWPDMAEWGYYLLPRSHPDSPGYSGLLVALRPRPTGQHFDPETMDLRLVAGGYPDPVTLTPHQPPPAARIFPGRVILRDRRGKRVDFFCFGGELEAEGRPEERVYLLRSPAPILELNPNPEDVAHQLAAEVELMLGVFHARRANDDTLNRRLAGLDPLEFYQACLASILLRFERARALQVSYRDFYGALLREKVWLLKMGRWPANPPTLGALLEPETNPA